MGSCVVVLILVLFFVVLLLFYISRLDAPNWLLSILNTIMK